MDLLLVEVTSGENESTHHQYCVQPTLAKYALSELDTDIKALLDKSYYYYSKKLEEAINAYFDPKKNIEKFQLTLEIEENCKACLAYDPEIKRKISSYDLPSWEEHLKENAEEPAEDLSKYSPTTEAINSLNTYIKSLSIKRQKNRKQSYLRSGSCLIEHIMEANVMQGKRAPHAITLDSIVRRVEDKKCTEISNYGRLLIQYATSLVLMNNFKEAEEILVTYNGRIKDDKLAQANANKLKGFIQASLIQADNKKQCIELANSYYTAAEKMFINLESKSGKNANLFGQADLARRTVKN